MCSGGQILFVYLFLFVKKLDFLLIYFMEITFVCQHETKSRQDNMILLMMDRL